MIELRQSWPVPDHPLPIVIFGAGSIVTDAHIPAYTASGFVIQGIYDPDLGKAQALAKKTGSLPMPQRKKPLRRVTSSLIWPRRPMLIPKYWQSCPRVPGC